MKTEGYNRNIIGGKRPHKGVQKYGKYKTISDRLIAECKGIEQYKRRISNPLTHTG
jgi:hypothetical protein